MNRYEDLPLRDQALYKLCEFDNEGQRDVLFDYIETLEAIILSHVNSTECTPKQKSVLDIIMSKK